MSKIYLHKKNDTVYVQGRERYNIGLLVVGMTVGVLTPLIDCLPGK